MTTLDNHKEWALLKAHHETMATLNMATAFLKNPARFQQLSLTVGDILLDYSKNLVTEETLLLLSKLALSAQLPYKIQALFSGKPLNFTEKKPVLHTALRNLTEESLIINQQNILSDIHLTLNKMRDFVDKVRNQVWRGSTGKPITDIVILGIGGSHLGPEMAVHALKEYATPALQCHYISNIDSAHLNEVLNQIDPHTSLFIISSKSFTTLETMANARTIRDWLKNQLKTNSLTNHFVAATAAPSKAIAFGIPESQVFPFWDWVGGRYSIWSAVGLPIALMIGMPRFIEMLEGAAEMDHHFQTAPLTDNMPVILALLGIWYVNFFGATNHAIIPYTHTLNYLPAYLQQADMESNGKNITAHNTEPHYATGPIVWGEQGCNGQHAFYQLLHQGKHLIPVDFILVAENQSSFPHHQDMLIGSALSQSQALMQGKSYEKVLAELLAMGMNETEAKSLAFHKVIPGNRPSNILFLKKMSPHNLGALLALYEHKIFVQGILWNINSYDQWGVELGKQLLPPILKDLTEQTLHADHDASTAALINYYKKHKESP